MSSEEPLRSIVVVGRWSWQRGEILLSKRAIVISSKPGYLILRPRPLVLTVASALTLLLAVLELGQLIVTISITRASGFGIGNLILSLTAIFAAGAMLYELWWSRWLAAAIYLIDIVPLAYLVYLGAFRSSEGLAVLSIAVPFFLTAFSPASTSAIRFASGYSASCDAYRPSVNVDELAKRSRGSVYLPVSSITEVEVTRRGRIRPGMIYISHDKGRHEARLISGAPIHDFVGAVSEVLPRKVKVS